MTPPVLPGEVWRGDVDGPACVTVRDGEARAWEWWPNDAEWVRRRDDGIMAAWALSLRADAQRAAKQMREACADVADTLRAKGGNQAQAIAAAIRALPLPDEVAKVEAAREAASLHVPGCARVETEGAGHPGACVEPTAANDRGKR